MSRNCADHVDRKMEPFDQWLHNGDHNYTSRLLECKHLRNGEGDHNYTKCTECHEPPKENDDSYEIISYEQLWEVEHNYAKTKLNNNYNNVVQRPSQDDMEVLFQWIPEIPFGDGEDIKPSSLMVELEELVSSEVTLEEKADALDLDTLPEFLWDNFDEYGFQSTDIKPPEAYEELILTPEPECSQKPEIPHQGFGALENIDEPDKTCDGIPISSENDRPWDVPCSVSMFTYNLEASSNVVANIEGCETNASQYVKPEFDLDGRIVLTEEKKHKESSTELDRYAFFTDGQTCWNPFLVVGTKHPIPTLETPYQKFRYFHSNLLKSLVREAVTRRLCSNIFTTFENRCLDVGVLGSDIELFRISGYDIKVINEIFRKKTLNKMTPDNRIKWLTMQPDLKKAVSSLERGLGSITSAVIDDHLRNPEVQVDWLFVSAQMLIRGSRNVSPEGCERLWKNAFSPIIALPYRWSQQEFSMLKALSMRPGKRNFVKIAKEMGSKFSPFLCLKMFAKYVRPLVEEAQADDRDDDELYSAWKQDEVQEEYKICMEMFNGSLRCTSLWLSHAYNVDFSEKFLTQQSERYKIGQFSMHENGILCIVDEIIQAHKGSLHTFNDFLPWRPEEAWTHRLDSIRFPHRSNSGGRNEWSESEDRLLLKLAKKYHKDWIRTEKHFIHPRRTGKCIHARYVLLAYALRKCTLEEFHANHREVLSTRFYYMRKTLAFLEELDKTRTELNISSSPDATTIVRKLFEECNANFKLNSICLTPSNTSWKLFPQTRHIRNLIYQIPRFYFQQAVGKMNSFLKAAGVPPDLPR